MTRQRYLAFILALIVAVVFLCSCSCDWYLTKAKEKCGSAVISQTVTVHDTIKVKESKVDTIFKQGRDTVIIREGRLTMKYFYNDHDSTVFLDGKCDTVFVIREIQVVTDKVELKEGFGDWIKRFWWIPALLVLGLAVWRFVKGR